MDKNTRRNIKLNHTVPQLDIDEFNKLTDLLFEAAKENNAYCARLLGVSTITWKKWTNDPPTWPWWNLVLRQAIKHLIANLVAQRRMNTKKHKQRVIQALARIPQSDIMEDSIASLAYDIRGAELHLRNLLARRGMFADEIYKAGNAGGYTPRMLRTAAKKLGVVKQSEGFGEDKRSYWRLPTEEDD